MTPRILLALLLLAAPLEAVGQEVQPAGDAAHGRHLFDTLGCGACHGYEGQGSRDGPRLNPPPTFPVTLLQLRQPRNLMPPFREAILSDQDAADLQAYMMSFPPPPDPQSIPLLQNN
jgi:mono/diheme cytochrome c family protein